MSIMLNLFLPILCVVDVLVGVVGVVEIAAVVVAALAVVNVNKKPGRVTLPSVLNL